MTQLSIKETLVRIATAAPVIPVITIRNITHAKPLAETLIENGLSVLEVTLRTECALDAIAIMSKVEGAFVGAGTLRSAGDIARVRDAGAAFGLSPGSPHHLLSAANSAAFPFVPGVASATEAMEAAELGYTFQKFFPAEASGGAQALGGLAAPLSDIRFCPTGGVSESNALSYLSLPNVVCVGGSWIATDEAMLAGNWQEIGARAKEAADLR